MLFQLCDVLVEEEKFEEFLELSIMALMNPIFMMDTNKIPVSDYLAIKVWGVPGVVHHGAHELHLFDGYKQDTSELLLSH